jgi:lipoprotein-anchoring transpeptidase ErfK/SrfK
MERLFAVSSPEAQPIGWFTDRRTVEIPTKYNKGDIIIRTGQRRLYLVIAKGKAYRYKVGVGREGYAWSGVSYVSRKAKWPGWTPPAAMRKREPHLPAYMPGGPKNPLGARALYLGSTLYRIHGTRAQHTIGRAVSSGCIRMLNKDVIDLYNRVKIGARVHVIQ